MPFINQPIIDINGPYNQYMNQIGQGLGAAAGGFVGGRMKQNRFQELAKKLGLNEQEAAEFQADPKGVLDRRAKMQPTEIGEAHGSVLDRTLPLQPKTFRTPTADQIRESTPDSTYIQPTGETERPYGAEAPFGKDARTGQPMTPEGLEQLLQANVTAPQSWAGRKVPQGELDDLLRAGTTLYGTDQRAKTAQEMAELRALLYEDRQNRQDDRMRETQGRIDARFQQGSNIALPFVDENGNPIVMNSRGEPNPRPVPVQGGGTPLPRPIAPTQDAQNQIKSIDNISAMATRTKELLAKHPDSVGFVVGQPWGVPLLQKMGVVNNPEVAELYTNLNQLYKMVYGESGKQIGIYEIAKQSGWLPAPDQAPELTASQLDELLEQLGRLRQSTFDLSEQSGRPFRGAGAPQPPQSGQPPKILSITPVR